MLQESRNTSPSHWSQPAGPQDLDLRSTLRSLPFLRDLVPLWVLSDESLGFCVHGGRTSGETRWLHKHTVTWGAAEVHPVLDSPVVLTYRKIIINKENNCGSINVPNLHIVSHLNLSYTREKTCHLVSIVNADNTSSTVGGSMQPQQQ